MLERDASSHGQNLGKIATQGDESTHVTFCKFCDCIYYPCLEATISRPYGLYVHGASDTTGAVRGVETITTGLKWKQIQPPVLVTGGLDEATRAACWELGATAAASLMIG
jgi:hypothetical protein